MSAQPNRSQEPWSVGRLLGWTTDHFRRHGVEEPRLCAEILLAHAIGCQRIDLYTRFDGVPGADVLDTFRDLVRRGAHHTPVAYLVGHREFFSLAFEVTPDVLIPRPETETLVERGSALCRRRSHSPCHVLDLGTGSGCVIIALLKREVDAVGVATDISTAALDVARRNAARHGVSDRITFARADRLSLSAARPYVPDGGAHHPAEWLPAGGFHLIVSNPPYVSEADMAALPPNVRDHEPAIALTAGGDGLDFYRAIATDAGDLLADGGDVLVEIGAGQRDAVRAILTASGAFVHAGTHRSPTDPHERVMHVTKV